MPKTYNRPGVYCEDVVIKTKLSLPTGVPGFVGFADETGDSSVETRVALSAQSAGNSIPKAKDDDHVIWYDTSGKCLVCTGPMSGESFTQVLKLFPDDTGRRALKQLYRSSQRRLNLPVLLYRKAEFALYFNTLPFGKSYLVDAVNGFFDNGGVYCYVVHADATDAQADALITAIDGLSSLNDIDLVAVPDCMVLNAAEDVFAVQRNALVHCALNTNRFAILDSLGLRQSAQANIVNTLKDQRQKIVDIKNSDIDIIKLAKLSGATNPAANGALYFPWIQTLDRQDNGPVPPCGHIAGIYARSDKRAGISKAPANEEVLGVHDLEHEVTNGLQDDLIPERINCLRAFPGRGIRVWGARTLCQDETWQYINVRRLMLFVSRWIEENLIWAAFEPNTPRLWIRISRELTVYLTKLWQSGALSGSKPEQAFFVKCDKETNSAEMIEKGEVMTQVGLAPTVPAEFIIVRVIHHAGTTEIT